MTTKACCDGGVPPPCEGEPAGRVHKIGGVPLIGAGGLPVYEVGEGDKAIIAVYDIFGFTENKRTRLVCDQMAKAGYRVILPDFFRGTDVLKEFGTFPPEGGIPAVVDWVTKTAPLDKTVNEVFDVVVKHLESKGVKSIGMVGFCWGGKVVVLSSTRSKIKAAVGIHPSFLEPKDMDAVDCPQMFLPAGNDPPIDPIWDAIQSKPFSKSCEKKVFTDMAHGWSLRADMTDPKAKEAQQANEAIEMTIKFLNAHV